MIDSTQLREYVIRPVLKDMGHYSPAAENLLVMIAAHESKMGTYIKQISGPALGIYQMEPDTAVDALHHLEDTGDYMWTYDLDVMSGNTSMPAALTWDLGYQTAMARIHLLRFEEPLPHADDLVGLADYAKRYWNTAAGKATKEDYLEAYKPHHV